MAAKTAWAGARIKMHQIRISPEVIKLASQQRGGKLHMFDDIDPARTAHLIVDLQNGFMEKGAPVEVPVAREIVPNVNAISRAARSVGALNVFIRYTTDDEALDSWSTWYTRFHSPQSRATMRDAFGPGRHHWQLWPGLDVAKEDLKVDKTRFGAFVPGTCNLHEILQKRGIDTLIITGTLTNCCSESTARAAMQMNYKVIFVADGNAALSDDAHNATLTSMCGLFADVRTTEETIAVLERAARPTQVKHTA
jgi:ureidoacrylate peracid hydrolase